MKSKLCSKYCWDYRLVAKKKKKKPVGSLSYILHENKSQIDQRINK